MTPGQVVKAVALALDVPEETVTQHDRNLVVAGLRTKGGRGRSAPDVTPLDAARLFVATLGSVRAKDSVATVRTFEESIYRPTPRKDWAATAAELRKQGNFEAEKWALEMHNKALNFSDPAIEALPKKHNFVEAIASLISEASLPVEDLDEHLQRFAELIVQCENRGHADAIINKMGTSGGDAIYKRNPHKKFANAPNPSPELPRYKRYARYYGISQRRSVFGTAIMLLGKAFRDDGLPFDTTRAALAALLSSQKRPAKAKGKAA